MATVCSGLEGVVAGFWRWVAVCGGLCAEGGDLPSGGGEGGWGEGGRGLTDEQVLGELRLSVPGARARVRVTGVEEVAGELRGRGAALVQVDALVSTLRAAVASSERALGAYRDLVERQGEEIASLKQR